MRKRPYKVAVFGATSGMGRALARQLVERGDRVFVLGIDRAQLEKTAQDLSVHGRGQKVEFAECDLMQPDGFEAALDAADAALGGFDTVVMTAAIFATQDALEQDSALTAKLLTADFTNTILFCEAAKKRLLARKGGTLCVFSSVAGDRGRKPVVLYGASKAGLSRYLEALDHKHYADGLRVLTVKPGFVKTGMTAGLKAPPFAGEPEQVAARVIRGIDHEEAEIYAPAPWQLVMGVIKGLPRFVMRRVQF